MIRFAAVLSTALIYSGLSIAYSTCFFSASSISEGPVAALAALPANQLPKSPQPTPTIAPTTVPTTGTGMHEPIAAPAIAPAFAPKIHPPTSAAVFTVLFTSCLLPLSLPSVL